MFSGRNPRQLLIAATTFIGGLYFFLEYVLPKSSGVGTYHDQISTGVQVVGSMAVGLGILNILKVHGTKIIRTRTGWINSLALLLGMFVTLGVEFVDLIDSHKSALRRQEFDVILSFTEKIIANYERGENSAAANQVAATRQSLLELRGSLGSDSKNPVLATARDKLSANISSSIDKLNELGSANTVEQAQQTQSQLSDALLSAATSVQELAASEREISSTKKAKELLQQGLVESLGSAMFALLAFYIANAAYRAFRIRSVEAAVMMTSALIVMLGQIPFGPLYISDQLPAWRLWLIETISTPAFRAIYFGAAIAGLSMAVRMWLSLEKSPLAAETGKLGKGGQKE